MIKKKKKKKTEYTYNFNRFKILSSIYFISNKKDKRIKDVFDENDKVIFTYLNNNNNKLCGIYLFLTILKINSFYKIINVKFCNSFF